MQVLPELVDASPAALNRSFEAAVPAGEDPARYAHLLRQIRDAALSGGRSPAAARPLVDDSWQRAIGIGIDPDHGHEPPDRIGTAEVEFRRHSGKLASPPRAR